ncbi:cell division protein FtsQ/DivIB [Oleidesulfovibrio sp.]|uniref:cell division protein FtsQ/DivIB n=1 Tax=Oleidesulfovibrio sp. TaxID=2909707 RepID=UPI003A8B15CC
MLILSAVSVSYLYAYRILISSDYFAARAIEIQGADRITPNEVLTASELSIGSNLFSVSIVKVERALLENNWVKNVSVKRLLPDRIHIRIEERIPQFWVQKGGVLCYADREGRVIAPVTSAKFTSLPLLQVDNEAAELLGYLPALDTAVESSTLPMQLSDASAVRLGAGRTVELYLEDRNLRLAFGLDDVDGDLKRLGLVLADLSRRGELENARDVRVAGTNVWVRQNPVAAWAAQ